MVREEQERAQGNRVREAMLQARFLSINSKALSVMKTPQHFFYFKFKKKFSKDINNCCIFKSSFYGYEL